MKNFSLLVLTLLVLANSSFAGGFNLSFSGIDCAAFPDAATCNSALSQISSSFNTLFSQNLLSDFVSAAGNANAMSSRSSFTPGLIDADKNYWVGLSVNAGMQTPETKNSSSTEAQTNKLPGLGLGAQAFATIGISGEKFGDPFNLDVDPKLMTYVLSLGTYSLSSKSIKYQFVHVGLGGSFQLQQPKPWNFVVGWSGIRASGGLVYTRTKLTYATPVNFSGNGGGTTASWDSKLDLGLVSDVLTVPLDITTGIHILKIFTLYGGLGIDTNLGSGRTEGFYDGVATANGSRVANIHVDANSDREKVTFLQIRSLLGIQLGLDPIHIHFQVAFANPRTMGAQLGLVAAW